MDQLKEVLRQLIKFRFWIAVGISALLPVIAYVVGVGPIQQRAVAEASVIDQAAKGVKQFTSGTPVNRQYSETVTAKTEDLVKDVDQSWKKLYDRQAELLTWPESVHERFTAWGRQWPKDTDASAVQIAIINYVDAYPKFVTDVYKSFHPYDYVEGTGVVSAPTEEVLLRPSLFSESAPPGLGKVWSAQERLWIQRTLLDVVAKVNKDAKGWDSRSSNRSTAWRSGIRRPRTSGRSPRPKSSKRPPTSSTPQRLPPRPTRRAPRARPRLPAPAVRWRARARRPRTPSRSTSSRATARPSRSSRSRSRC